MAASELGARGLGRLTAVDPRSIWRHEALDFTPWLLDNADVLADALGIELELTANEHPVGGFSLDLLGADLTNDCTLIVENQLTGTDHSHLGQLITYAAGTDAATIVWLATEFRDEHRQAIDFLNDLGGEKARFFGVEINAVQIGDSLAAPLLRVVAEPNDWHAAVSSGAKAAQATGGKGLLYRSFWERFLPALHEAIPNWSKAKKPQSQNWMNLYWPTSGATFVAAFGKNGQMRVELYIDTGDEALNNELFDHLKSQQVEIEAAFGEPLVWEDLPTRRACRVSVQGVGDVLNEEGHDLYVSWMIDALKRMRHAFPAARFVLSESMPEHS